MDKGLLTRILGSISIPIIFRGIVSLIMREKEREMTYNLRKERIVIRPPKVIGWIAVMGMLFCTTVLLIILLYQNGIEFPVVFHGTESPVVFLGFFLFDLLGAYLLWITLVWQVEVFKNEDFFILMDYWGRKHKIHYADCTSYQYRYRHQEIIVRNRTLCDALANVRASASRVQSVQKIKNGLQIVQILFRHLHALMNGADHLGDVG